MRGKKKVKKISAKSKKLKEKTASTVKKKKTRKRRTKRLYFGPETDEAIGEFQATDSIDEKQKIYEATIQPSFSKLVENLIFIHGFAKNHYSYEALKGDCVSFLYENLCKFDASRGTKAFSYFNVVAKNWLIIQSKKRTRNIIRNVSMSNISKMKTKDRLTIESHNVDHSPDDYVISSENKAILEEIFQKLKKKVSSPNEIVCLNAIITLFGKIDDLDYLNKRAIFVYLRDISGLTPKQLSVAMSNIRKHYKEIKNIDRSYYSLFFI